MSLFGSTNNQQSKPGLFPSLNTTTSQPQQSGGLFSNLGGPQQNQQQQQGGGLLSGLGQNNNQQQQNTGGLFSGSNQQQGAGLFGSSTQQQQGGGGLFGGSTQQNQQQTGGLFGSSQQPQQGGQSLFGGSVNPVNTNIGFGANPVWQPPVDYQRRERSIPQQIEELYNKWNANDATRCAFQHYFYNNVPADVAPFYSPQEWEDVQKWEEALKKKPSENAIPVLGIGFNSIVARMEKQKEFVTAFQTRLHEMNNALEVMLKRHDLDYSTRIAEAKRKHTALSQRCLAMATKVQVLKNRGYALGPAEEELKKKLVALEKTACDPVLSGRQEEIWARMGGIRARAQVLQDEMEKLQNKPTSAKENVIDEEAMATVKKLLTSYDSQLTHLKKELETIGKDFDEWEIGTRPVVNGGTPARR